MPRKMISASMILIVVETWFAGITFTLICFSIIVAPLMNRVKTKVRYWALLQQRVLERCRAGWPFVKLQSTSMIA